MYELRDWLAASVVMVFIPTDGHGYRGNGSKIGSITGRNMLSTGGTSLYHHASITSYGRLKSDVSTPVPKPQETFLIP